MKIGQVVLLMDPKIPDYMGAVAIMTYIGLVCINNPQKTWAEGATILVDILPIGTRIEFTTEI